jgi:hypothetical protein
MDDEGRSDSPLSFFVVSRGTEARAPPMARSIRETHPAHPTAKQ